MNDGADNGLRDSHLVSTDWLARNLGVPSLRVVDMRGRVVTETSPDGVQTADYRGARHDYLAAHIPGAVYLDWTRDIVNLDDPVPAQVAQPEKIAAVLGTAGICDETLVVAYDDHPAAQFATRLWWVLRYYGHNAVRVLDGGLAKWRGEGRPLASGPESAPQCIFTPRRRAELRVSAEEVMALVGDPAVTLVDARDEGQYTGAIRRGPRGGHIPGAVHLPREALIAPDGTFRSTAELARVVHETGIEPDRRTVAYCNGGVAATSVLFALSMLGYSNLANYDGSWNEWSGRADLPVE